MSLPRNPPTGGPWHAAVSICSLRRLLKWPATLSPRATYWLCLALPGSRRPSWRRSSYRSATPLLVGAVTINFTIGDDYVEVETQVETVDRTGVEMEALTACAVAALSIYDMCKSVDRAMVIGDLALWEKTGGRSGHWRRETANVLNSGTTEVGRTSPIEEEIDGLIGGNTSAFEG